MDQFLVHKSDYREYAPFSLFDSQCHLNQNSLKAERIRSLSESKAENNKMLCQQTGQFILPSV